jgi:hypothetical protein
LAQVGFKKDFKMAMFSLRQNQISGNRDNLFWAK